MQVLSVREIEEVSGAGDAGAAGGCLVGAALVYYGSTAAMTAAGAVFGPGGAMIGYVVGSTFARTWGQTVGCAGGAYAGSSIENWLSAFF